MSKSNSEFLLAMSNHKDANVRHLAAEFKSSIRALWALTTCGHQIEGHPHATQEQNPDYPNSFVIKPCACSTHASKILQEWLLGLQD